MGSRRLHIRPPERTIEPMDHFTSASRPTPGQRALADALARGEAAMGAGMETLAASLYTDPDR